jgi:hypothetical protein
VSPKRPPSGLDGTEDDAFGLSNILGTLPETELVLFCSGPDFGTVVPELGILSSPAAGPLVVEEGACSVILPFFTMVLDSEGRSEAGFALAVD